MPGSVAAVSYSPGASEATVFVQPLSDVMRYWLFSPPLGDDCVPRQERIVTRVMFEIAEGKPRVSASRARTSDEMQPRPDHMSLVHQPRPVFPRPMARGDNTAEVYAKLTIEPDGSVSNVAIKVFTNADSEYSFADATRTAVRRWRFRSHDTPRPRYSCVQLSYRLVD